MKTYFEHGGRVWVRYDDGQVLLLAGDGARQAFQEQKAKRTIQGVEGMIGALGLNAGQIDDAITSRGPAEYGRLQEARRTMRTGHTGPAKPLRETIDNSHVHDFTGMDVYGNGQSGPGPDGHVHPVRAYLALTVDGHSHRAGASDMVPQAA